jgi:hypothetical protein
MRPLLLILFLACQVPGRAQVSIGKLTADTSALLDLETTKKGLLLPRLSQTQRMTIQSPGRSLLYYQTTSPEGFYHYKRDPLATWLPLLPYSLTQNMRLGNYRVQGNRLNNSGLAINKDGVAIQSALPGSPAAIGSLLALYNDDITVINELRYVNLASFKNMFGLSMMSMRFANTSFDHFGIFQNSISGPMARFVIGSYFVDIGDFLTGEHSPANFRIDGNLQFNGNIDIGVTYDYNDFTLPANTTNQFKCYCRHGQVISGGGGVRDGGIPHQGVKIIYSGPEYSGWILNVRNPTNHDLVIRVYAVCSNILYTL